MVIVNDNASTVSLSSRRCREVGEDQGEGEDVSTTARQQQRIVGHVTRCHCHIVSVGVVWPRIFPLSSIWSPAHVLPNHNRAPTYNSGSLQEHNKGHTTRKSPNYQRRTCDQKHPKIEGALRLCLPDGTLFRYIPCESTCGHAGVSQRSPAFRKHCPRLYFAIEMVSLSGQRGGSYAALESDDAIVSRLARQDRVPWYNKPNLRSLYFLMAPTCLGAEILFG